MLARDAIGEGARMMTICNACRYCEQYCPVFPAMERRQTFAAHDLAYLANLCHNCGECLYACQYAPPHEFAVNVPQALGRLRTDTYETYCWPRRLGVLFRNAPAATCAALVLGFVVIIAAAARWRLNDAVWISTDARFYDVLPHGVMVTLFGAAMTWAVLAIAIGLARYWRDIAPKATAPGARGGLADGIRDALTLRHLHDAGADCTTSEESRDARRRWFHHSTFYGFVLCVASTTTAAFYHIVLGWEAPYPYTSLPVLLGSIGGAGLLIGPLGLLFDRKRRDRALTDARHAELDVSFTLLLLLTSLTGVLLLALRATTMMSALLIVHLAVVLALFVSLPYGKFVHGLYRTAALIASARETAAER